MEKLKKAIAYATVAHAGQSRSDGSPYYKHPIKVMKQLSSLGESNENILCAAVLHDVLEDTSVTKEEINRDFGKEIADIVIQLTNKHPPKTPFVIKQAQLIEHAKHMTDDAKKIKVADRYDNIMDMNTWPLWKQRRYAKAATELLSALRPVPEMVEPLVRGIETRCENILKAIKEGTLNGNE